MTIQPVTTPSFPWARPSELKLAIGRELPGTSGMTHLASLEDPRSWDDQGWERGPNA